MDNVPTPSPNMSVDSLVELLRVHSAALVQQEGKIEVLAAAVKAQQAVLQQVIARQSELAQLLDRQQDQILHLLEALSPPDPEKTSKGGLLN